MTDSTGDKRKMQLPRFGLTATAVLIVLALASCASYPPRPVYDSPYKGLLQGSVVDAPRPWLSNTDKQRLALIISDNTERAFTYAEAHLAGEKTSAFISEEYREKEATITNVRIPMSRVTNELRRYFGSVQLADNFGALKTGRFDSAALVDVQLSFPSSAEFYSSGLAPREVRRYFSKVSIIFFDEDTRRVATLEGVGVAYDEDYHGDREAFTTRTARCYGTRS